MSNRDLIKNIYPSALQTTEKAMYKMHRCVRKAEARGSPLRGAYHKVSFEVTYHWYNAYRNVCGLLHLLEVWCCVIMGVAMDPN